MGAEAAAARVRQLLVRILRSCAARGSAASWPALGGNSQEKAKGNREFRTELLDFPKTMATPRGRSKRRGAFEVSSDGLPLRSSGRQVL
ncbi:hypothetical protein LEMLEM_LOCUS8405 [Lemmus lemmus]